jgi:O-acetyl-ADP-ribose deacetylase (regulator of RNase III)
VIEIIREDITILQVDAMVNAANSSLRGGGGVDGAIHRAAGPGLLRELMRYDHCPAGSAVITGGHDLHARYVIHAVGPVWAGGRSNEAELLRSAYRACFALAHEKGDIRSIAFPAISTGIYRFPKPLAARIAMAEMKEHEPRFERIIACVFDEENLRAYELASAATA